MVCEKCGCEAIIARKRYEVEGDSSADDRTKVYSVLEFECRNKKCEMCGKVVGETRSCVYGE